MNDIINRINTLLSSPTRYIHDHRAQIKTILLIIAYSLIGFAAFTDFQKSLGEWAYNLLLFILIIGPLYRVSGIKILGTPLLFRRELGILMGMLVVMHFTTFLIKNALYLDVIILNPEIWLLAGFSAFILTFLLLITSNNWALKKLGKWWRRLHRFVYIILILVLIHVVLLKAAGDYKGPDFIGNFIETLIPVVALFALKIADFLGVRLTR